MARQRTLVSASLLCGLALGCGQARAQCPFGWIAGFASPGANDAVICMTVFDDDGPGPRPSALYVGGWFNTIAGVSASHVARWDGTRWEPLGSGTNGRYVAALAVYDDGSGPALYAGGEFDQAGGMPASNIARWNGSSWSALGPGVNGHVFSLLGHNDGFGSVLFVGGAFSSAGPVNASRIARWNGSVWAGVGPGMSGTQTEVRAFAVYGFGNALHAGGFFHVVGNFIASWNGFSWAGLGTGMDSTVYALCTGEENSNPVLYAGGYFDRATNVTVNRIARWDGSEWSSLAGGITASSGSPFIWALATFDDGSGPALYAGGNFTAMGGVPASSIARWNGSAWAPLGSGLGGSFPWVFCLGSYNDGAGPALYVGGSFSAIGGLPANGIAKWAAGPPSISQQPLGMTVRAGGVAMFTAAANGATSYRWRRNHVNLDDGPRISGAMTASLTIDPVQMGDAGDYELVASSACGSVMSDPATLVVECYPNCDGSSSPVFLNVNDFICFQSAFAAGQPYADCNRDSAFNVNDFVCFQSSFAAACP